MSSYQLVRRVMNISRERLTAPVLQPVTSSGVRRFSPSRIGLRLLAFNVLVVFVPVLGILYLDVYENRFVRASPERVAQVFDNIVGNAASFTPDGTTVDVAVAEASSICVVTVDDRGPGIPESHLDRVFSRFFTYRPTERRGDHIGLGLAIAKQIVESYGGSIAASNRDGGGARFDTRLPGCETVAEPWNPRTVEYSHKEMP